MLSLSSNKLLDFVFIGKLESLTSFHNGSLRMSSTHFELWWDNETCLFGNHFDLWKQQSGWLGGDNFSGDFLDHESCN